MKKYVYYVNVENMSSKQAALYLQKTKEEFMKDVNRNEEMWCFIPVTKRDNEICVLP